MSTNRPTHDREEKNAIVGGTLYLVATPIGNLADLSERAIKTLSEVDFVAAEDTRNSGKLLACFGISKPMVSYHEHNKREKGESIVSRLLSGESCALVTDAGTPAISDPGEDLVRLCAERGVPVTSVPGACAAVNALALSGLATGRFVFEGFLPVPKSERRERLSVLAEETRTAILYEAPHKLRTTLDDLLATLGNRRITLCRELTKMNEEILRTTLEQAVEIYGEREPRGEYVLILEGGEGGKKKASFFEGMTVEEHVAHYMAAGMSKMDATKAVAKDLGVPKNEIYRKINT